MKGAAGMGGRAQSIHMQRAQQLRTFKELLYLTMYEQDYAIAAYSVLCQQSYNARHARGGAGDRSVAHVHSRLCCPDRQSHGTTLSSWQMSSVSCNAAATVT